MCFCFLSLRRYSVFLHGFPSALNRRAIPYIEQKSSTSCVRCFERNCIVTFYMKSIDLFGLWHRIRNITRRSAAHKGLPGGVRPLSAHIAHIGKLEIMTGARMVMISYVLIHIIVIPKQNISNCSATRSRAIVTRNSANSVSVSPFLTPFGADGQLSGRTHAIHNTRMYRIACGIKIYNNIVCLSRTRRYLCTCAVERELRYVHYPIWIGSGITIPSV